MVMVADTNVWTPERVLALPEDGNRYEVIDGELLVTRTQRFDHHLDARLMERWRPEDKRPEILSDRMLWQPHLAVEPLAIELGTFFSEALGGE